jgi:hypothetical protein
MPGRRERPGPTQGQGRNGTLGREPPWDARVSGESRQDRQGIGREPPGRQERQGIGRKPQGSPGTPGSEGKGGTAEHFDIKLAGLLGSSSNPLAPLAVHLPSLPLAPNAMAPRPKRDGPSPQTRWPLAPNAMAPRPIALAPRCHRDCACPVAIARRRQRDCALPHRASQPGAIVTAPCPVPLCTQMRS